MFETFEASAALILSSFMTRVFIFTHIFIIYMTFYKLFVVHLLLPKTTEITAGCFHVGSEEWAEAAAAQASVEWAEPVTFPVSVEWAEPATSQPMAWCFPPQQWQATPRRWQARSGA